MDRDVRDYLINLARIKRTVAYGTIMQNFGYNVADRPHVDLFAEIIGEISEHEHSFGRPMLSSLVIHADGRTIGAGFYPLAEKLGHGDAEVLRKKHFEKEMQERCYKEWSTPIKQEPIHPVDFFTQNELNFYNEWAGKRYDSNNRGHRDSGEKIKNTIFEKTYYWAEQVAQQLTDLNFECKRHWLERGVTFKKYSWAQIAIELDKGIFFTVGVDGTENVLVYKLDYEREGNTELSQEQKQICKGIIPKEVQWIQIENDELSAYSWDLLIKETVDFIQKNLELFKRIVKSVWEGFIDVPHITNTLFEVDIPEEGVDTIPERKHSFQGRDVNWTEKQKKDSELGKIGEELVIEHERKKLINAGLIEESAKVKKVKDGKGYDITSIELDGSPKFIEVKSTCSNDKSSFPISLTEVAFSEAHDESFYIYRVFNIHCERRTGKLHVYKGSIHQHFLLESVEFLTHKKKS